MTTQPRRTGFGRSAALFLGLAAALGLGTGSEAGAAGTTTSLGEMNCRAVSTRTMQRLQGTLRDAHSAAGTDAARNGSNGAYAVAATNSRDLIKRALDRSARMISDHNSSDPNTTTAAEAGTAKEHTRAIIEVLPQAAHWAAISNIYHKSPDARRAFDGAAAALQQGQALFVDASNCYMDGWTP